MRVVQIDPGPIPTLIASAPASASAFAASAVATLPATTWTEFETPFTRSTALATSRVVAVRGVDHDAIAAGVDQRFRASKAGIADGRRRRYPQPPFGILGGKRRGDRLFDVLDGDQPDAMIVLVDDQQFLDPALVKDPPRLGLGGADRHRRKIVPRHQLADRLARIFGEANVPIGQNSAQLARFLDDRDPADPVRSSSAPALRPASGRGSW